MTISIGKEAIKHGIAMGAEEIEAFYSSGRIVIIESQRDEIEFAQESLMQGLGIRTIVKGAVGFASTNDLSKVKETVESAVKCAVARNADPNWKSLPLAERYPEVKGGYDGKIAELDLDRCIDYSLQMIEGARQEKAMPTASRFTCGNSKEVIMNSNGVEIEEKSTFLQASIETIAKNQSTSTAFEFDVSRSLNINFAEIGKTASKLALSSLNGTAIETCSTAVLLKPIAFADLIASIFLPSVYADSVQKKRSLLKDRVGKSIAGEDLNLIDDGLIEGGMGSAKSDDEGTPSQRTPIIEKGVLKTFLYDSYTAGKEGLRSTGNGMRGSYAGVPSVGIRNLVVTHPESDVIGETKSGIIINSIIGSHTSNPISGDFSVEARNAFLIEKGEITKPVKSAMITGNIFEAIKQITGCGRDARKVGSIITPTVRIDGLRVVG